MLTRPLNLNEFVFFRLPDSCKPREHEKEGRVSPAVRRGRPRGVLPEKKNHPLPSPIQGGGARMGPQDSTPETATAARTVEKTLREPTLLVRRNDDDLRITAHCSSADMVKEKDEPRVAG